jgi:ribonuclease R
VQIRARFRPHPRGFGFLHPVAADRITPVEVDGTDRVFVPPPLARGLIADDLVDATAEADDKGVTAREITIVERPRRMLVGTVTNGPGRLVLEPERTLGSGWVALAEPVADQLSGALGRVVVVLRTEDESGTPIAQALVAGPYVAGSPQAVRALAVVLTVDRVAPSLVAGGAEAGGLEPAKAALTHTRFVGLVAGGGRGGAAGLDPDGPVPGAALEPVDRRNDPAVSIDDAATRDLDDALAAHHPGGDAPVEVAVHIADVAGAVGIDSAADRYARTVATTTYPLVGASAPMLDPALSEDALSLLPDTDRHVLSVRFQVASDGTVSDARVELATIRSDARLTYAAVERWLDGDDTGLVAEAGEAAASAIAQVAALVEAGRRLGVERDARLTFEELFASPTLTPMLVDGRLAVADAEPHARAYRVVERLMVAANEAVAAHLVATGVPALYRAHAGLDADRFDRLAAAVALAGAEVPALREPDADPASIAAELLVEIERLGTERPEDRELLVAVATASTARAAYDPDPRHHRGLAVAAYTHFTSPIRRYADLVVHRQLRATLAGEVPPYDAATLSSLAGWLDARSGGITHLQARERAALWDRLLDRGFLETAEPAVVTGLTVNGLRVRLPRLGITGFVTAERALGLPAGERGRLVVDDHGLTTTSGPWRVGTTVGVRFVGLDDTDRPIWRLGDG